ncbi:hypothetical protein Patl1_29318 [Pistacia atlantica]|uniref:Uncharacterized protein n=1 Tax=Pistacia atlantica TaxID=434234 RepID=A0ACC1BH41_9ROSI|nr:hypothetical protein Patl1_29318 [Pistacia atlantica]
MVLDRRMIEKECRVGIELLVQWKGMAKEDTTWVDREELLQRFPTLEDRGF